MTAQQPETRSIFTPVVDYFTKIRHNLAFLFSFPNRKNDAVPHAPQEKKQRFYHIFDDDGMNCFTIHLPEKRSAGKIPAVIVYPGGAYGVLAFEKEGRAIAEFLAQNGIAGIAVKYPLGSMFGHFKRHPAMVESAQRVIRLIRYYAPQLGIDPDRIGTMGFSAGGHLAGLACTWREPTVHTLPENDPVDQVRATPDFVVFCYPVVTMEKGYAHAISRANLIGKNPPDELVKKLSLEQQITQDFPPSFLWQTLEDTCVDPENARMLDRALTENNIDHKTIIYEHGPHGMGLMTAREKEKFPETAKWSGELLDWLKQHGFTGEK